MITDIDGTTDAPKRKMKYCIYCGKQLEDDDSFCAYCGGKVSVDPPAAGKTSEAQQDAVRGSRAVLIIFAIVALIIGIAGFSYISENKGVGFLEDFTEEFAIEGYWQSVGEYGFGQAQPGEIVIFDEYRVNLYSPMDTYILEKDGDSYYLILDTFGEQTVFAVYVIDNDNIQLDYGGQITELHRIERDALQTTGQRMN